MNGFRVLAVLIPLFTSAGGRGVASPPPAIAPFIPDFFVSSTGSALNDGLTPETAWSLPHAFGAGAATILAQHVTNSAMGRPTDIRLLDGEYDYTWNPNGAISSSFNGSAVYPIRWRAESWAGAKLPLSQVLTINGTDHWFWDVEFTCTPTMIRAKADAVDNPPNGIGGSLQPAAARTKALNCLFNNVNYNGMFAGVPAVDLEVYGCIFITVGWWAGDRPHGHALYLQGDKSGWKNIKECISFGSFGIGPHCHGTGAAKMSNVNLEGFVAFQSGIRDLSSLSNAMNFFADGGETGFRGPIYLRNCHGWYNHEVAYCPTLRLNTEAATEWDYYSVEDCHLRGLVQANPATAWRYRRNTHYYTKQATNPIHIKVRRREANTPNGSIDMDENIYEKRTGTNSWSHLEETIGTPVYASSLVEWNSQHPPWEANGVWTPAAPSGARPFVRKNIYEVGRGHVICYNWGKLITSGTAATNTLNIVAHGHANGDQVALAELPAGDGTGLLNNTIYFVVNKTDDTLQLSLSEGGAAEDFSTDITSVTDAASTRLVPANLSINLSGGDGDDIGLGIGDSFEVRHVTKLQDNPWPAADVSGTYDGNAVSFPQVGFVIPEPKGDLNGEVVLDPVGTPSPLFNVYLVRKT